MRVNHRDIYSSMLCIIVFYIMILLCTITVVNSENNAMSGAASMKTVPVSQGLKLFQFNTNMFSMDGSMAKGGHSKSKEFQGVNVKSKDSSSSMSQTKGSSSKGKLSSNIGSKYGFKTTNYHWQVINQMGKNCQKFNGEFTSYMREMQRSSNNYRRLDLTLDFMLTHKRIAAVGAVGLLNLYVRSFPQPEK